MRQRIYKKIMSVAAILLAVNCVFSFFAPVLAADDTDIYWGNSEQKDYIETNSGLPAEANLNDPRQLIAQIIRVVLGFLGILAVIIVLYAGFKWMTSGGNEETVGDAKKMLIAGLIGLVIIIFAYAIANFVINQIIDVTNGR